MLTQRNKGNKKCIISLLKLTVNMAMLPNTWAKKRICSPRRHSNHKLKTKQKENHTALCCMLTAKKTKQVAM